MKTPNKFFNIKWYHGTEHALPGEPEKLKPLYLAPSPTISKLHGKNIYTFKISPNSTWLDLDAYEYSAPGIDSFGYLPHQIEKFRNKGYDVVWDSEDYKRGSQQIFVLNPKVLIPIEKENNDQELQTVIEKIVSEVMKKL